MRKIRVSLLIGLIASVAWPAAWATVSAEEPTRPTLNIAFTSFRDDKLYANVFRYELTPDGAGKIVGKVSPVSNRSDHHLSLNKDGSRGVFAAEVVAAVSQIHLWDFTKNEEIALPKLNVTTTAQMAPSYCSAKGLIAFEAWNRPGQSGRWDIVLYDLVRTQFVDMPRLNTPKSDERKPAISPDGNWIAFTTNESMKQSLTDIRLYDRELGELDALSELNSTSMDTEPALSHDGRWLAFVSDRAGGAGVRDVYLFDRFERRLLPLPGLNSAGQEQSPSISSDGRFIAFVSERLEAVGERDIFLYDRVTEKLILTPGMNSSGDEYDPHVIVLVEP